MKVAVGDTIPPFRMERVTPERMKTVAAILRGFQPSRTLMHRVEPSTRVNYA